MSDSTSQSTPPGLKPDRFEPAPTGRRHHYWIWLVLLGLVVLAVIYFWHRGKSQSSAASGGGRGGRGGAQGPTMVSTATAYLGSIGIYVNALGVVTPLKTVSINSRVQGQIVAVKYQEGQMVKAGDPLLEIDPGPSQAALTQAEGQLMRDSAILQDAKIDLTRYQEAYASNAIPKQQLDTQVATVQQDEGTVKLDQGLLDNAQVQLNYCHVTAPISGRVGLRLVDEGNMAQANSTTALAVIAQLQPITVIFNVAEDDLPSIREQLHDGKTLTVDAFDRAQTRKLASGTLETLDNQIDPTTGTVKFRAIFTNDDESLFPNQFVNARLLVKTLEGATLLPNAVIQRNAEGAFVYLVKPSGTNQAGMRPNMGGESGGAASGGVSNANGGSGAATNLAGESGVMANTGGGNWGGTNMTGGTNGAGMGGARTNNLARATVALQVITAGTTDGNITAVEGIDPGAVVAADSFNKLTDGAAVLLRPSAAGAGGGRGKGGHRKKPPTPEE